MPHVHTNYEELILSLLMPYRTNILGGGGGGLKYDTQLYPNLDYKLQ